MKSLTNIFSAFVLFGVLCGGCTVGPDYSVPRVSAPTAFENAPASSNPPDLAWWRSFNDPILERLIVGASTNNHDRRRAEARLREARALWTESRFDLAPTIHANGGYEKAQSSKDVVGDRARRAELFRAGFDATWELDLWGAVRRDIEAARATVEAVSASRDDVLVTVQAEVAANYVQLRGAQAHLAVAARNATNQAQTLELAIALRDGGQGTQLDVARARSLLNETLASIPPFEADARRAIYRISVLCGLSPATLVSELSNAASLPEIPTDLGVSNPDDLIRNRPDVRAAERSLASTTARIGVEVADLFPRITFNGSIGVSSKSFSGLTGPGAETYSFGPRISWAAFDLGRVRQRIKAADARAEQALSIYEQTVLLALEETENSLLALSQEQRRLTFLTEAERAASEATQLARQRYRDGIADYLSVLDAERTLLDLQEQLVTTQTLTATRLVAVFKTFAAGRPQ
jgi:multidrug efflux system outer membrane protein